MDRRRRIGNSLTGAERSALGELAERELRAPRDQARLIVRCELERLGLLLAEPLPSQTHASKESPYEA